MIFLSFLFPQPVNKNISSPSKNAVLTLCDIFRVT